MTLRLDSSLAGVIQGAFVLATLAVLAWRRHAAANGGGGGSGGGPPLKPDGTIDLEAISKQMDNPLGNLWIIFTQNDTFTAHAVMQTQILKRHRADGTVQFVQEACYLFFCHLAFPLATSRRRPSRSEPFSRLCPRSPGSIDRWKTCPHWPC